MFSLFYGLWKYMLSKIEFHVLILGIDKAGKTTLLEKLKSLYSNLEGLPPDRIVPTVGLYWSNSSVKYKTCVLGPRRSEKILRHEDLQGAPSFDISKQAGYDLMGYIDGSTPCPSKQLANNATAINPAFTHWVRQDQLILHGIVSFVAATVVTHLGTVKTAKQAWDTLKTMYVGRSRVRIMALKQRISTFTKGTQSMATYLQGIKVISDELSIIDHPLDSIDLVIHTLNGLSVEYKEISATLRSRETPITYAELHEKLMDFETILSREGNPASDPLVATTNAVTRHKGQSRYRSQFNGHTSSSASNPANLVVCQFCDKSGHVARKCYKINGYPKRNGTRPSVNMANHQSAVQNSSWIMDTGASHHVIQDLQQLTLANSYPGSDQVMVGDGTGFEVESGSTARTT